MKELELLTILTNVRGEYILQAQELRSGNRKQPLRRIHRKRVFLIAAVISLLLLLVGCAAVLIGLQKISLGRVTFPQYSQPGWTLDLVSTNGYIDSVNYQATREWVDFITSYDADRTLEQQKDSSGYTAPEDYRIYNCYTPQMREKVDAICDKYTLQLAGPIYFAQEPDQVFAAVGIPSVWRENAGGQFSNYSGAYYRSGSFNLVGMVSHRFEGRDRENSLLFVYACDRKSVFFPDFVILGDMDSVDSWEYTAWDGTTLILAQSPTKGVIVADVGDCFVSVILNFCYSSPEGEVDAQNPCSREEFQKIADTFAYQLAPQAPASQWLQYPNGLNNGEVKMTETYYDYFSKWMPGSLGSEAYSPDYQQKFVDLDGDGADEMLIWNASTGLVYEVVTRVGERLQCLYSGDIILMEDSTRMYLCEGNTLEKDCGALQGKQLNEFYRMEDKQLLPVEVVMESNDGKFYWSESGGASSLIWKEITEAEYNALRAKYVRIGVPQSPTPERIEDLQKSEESILLGVLENREPFFSMGDGTSCTLSEYCGREGERMGLEVAITRYAFVDMDGDGIQEAVVDFRFGENREVMCMVLRYDSGYGMVQGTVFYYRQMYLIKEDGSFAYSGGADNAGWAKLRWENHAWTMETVGDSSGKRDVLWYSYPIALE